MQGKGLVQFFFGAMVLVCLFQLSFTWVANAHEKKAESYAISNIDPSLSGEARNIAIAEKKNEFFTEHAADNVYNIGIVKYNYDEVKKRALNLGLDLQGGMSVVMEVSKYDLVKQLGNDQKNQKFISALDKARVDEAKGDGEFIELFADHYLQDNPGASLVSLFTTTDNIDDLPRNSTNEDVISWLKNAADDGINSTYTKLKERIDKFGVTQPYVTLQKSTGRIMVELPGVDNTKRASELLQSTANLEFYLTYKYEEIGGALNQANNIAKAIEESDGEIETAVSANDTTMMNDSTGNAAAANDSSTDFLNQYAVDSDSTAIDTATAEENPLAEDAGPIAGILLQPSDPAAIGAVSEKDTAQLMHYLRMDEVLSVFKVNTRFMLSAKPIEGTNTYHLYALQTSLDTDEPLLDGSVIRSASPERDPINGKIGISMSMKSDGAREWYRITSDNIGNFVAIALDNKIYSAPVIQNAIAGGNSRISGDFTVEEATDLSNILEVGKLPVPSRIVQEDTVGPSLGAESIRVGVISLIVGLLLVVAFMVFYYASAGMVADLALFANLFFIFGVLTSIGATLTLPGIAGLVLTMGMAVDANVIIFERIREELDKGKSMIKAISDGFSGSYSAIIDSNITTLIIGIILSQFGTGPVKGFAVILIIGIISSLFTSILVSRLIIDWAAKRDRPVKYFNSITKHAFKNVKLNLIGKRRFGYMFSGAITIIGLVFIFSSGWNLGVDFKGGRNYTVKFDDSVDPQKVREMLHDMDAGVQVKTFSTSDKLSITTGYMIDSPDPNADSLVAVELFNHLAPMYPQGTDYAKWDAVYKESKMKVEPTIAEDIKTSAIKAIVMALIAIFIYILLRFRRWQFGFGALVSLVHDAFMVLALFAILKNVMPFSLEINEAFIAAILTVIGYSINDTVVVFDRIREYLRESKAGTVPQIFNMAINQTLSRTLVTSGTTLLSIIILLIFGNENIQGFAFALFIGIGFGTYSSIFVASAIAVDMYKKEDHHKSAEDVMK
ncbi:MAG: protein translocase subunit SecDF [Chitinophagales bacterium]